MNAPFARFLFVSLACLIFYGHYTLFLYTYYVDFSACSDCDCSQWPYIIDLAVVGVLLVAAGVAVAVLGWLRCGKSTRAVATQTSEDSEVLEEVVDSEVLEKDERNT